MIRTSPRSRFARAAGRCDRRLPSVLAFTLVVTWAGCASDRPGSARGSNAEDEAWRCGQLAETSLSEVDELEAAIAPSSSIAGLGRHCRVTGRIEGRVRFETRLPIGNWNGKFVMAGCGGFCGQLLPDKPGHANAINPAVAQGYAATAHDGGHQAPNYETDWALSDTRALELWAHAALPVVAETSQRLIETFYGRPPARRYFSGCSNGGRLGLMAAQRYPELFDGIAAGGAILDVTGNAAIHGAWLLENVGGAPTVLDWSDEEIEALRLHVLDACDAIDGITDGVIIDPRECGHVDLSGLACPAEEALLTSRPPTVCLNPSQIAFAEAMYRGARDSMGRPLFAPIEYGSEAYWRHWLLGEDDRPGWGQLAAQGQLNLAYGRASATPYPASRFDFDRDPDALREAFLAELIDAVDPGLSELVDAQTKLLIWHGWSDPLILPRRAVDYYESAVQAISDPAAASETLRLFMVPGHGHCWERPAEAPDRFDPVAMIDAWVEGGDAPDWILATQPDNEGGPLRTRPICAYPLVLVLPPQEDGGRGGFECRAPDTPR